MTHIFIKPMALALALVAFTFLQMTQLAASERHVGYYYPPITSEETFDRVVRSGPTPNKAVRVEFVTNITQAQLAAPETPDFAVLAKGSGAKELIMVGLNDQAFKTIYRARGYMAQLTANLRNGAFFRSQQLQHVATFYDFLQILQFDTLVLTDGETWSHRVTFKRN